MIIVVIIILEYMLYNPICSSLVLTHPQLQQTRTCFGVELVAGIKMHSSFRKPRKCFAAAPQLCRAMAMGHNGAIMGHRQPIFPSAKKTHCHEKM